MRLPFVTAAQLSALKWAERVADGLIGEVDGTTPRLGQHAMFRRLFKRGLLADGGVGEDDNSRPVPIYIITDLGRRAIAAKKGSQ